MHITAQWNYTKGYQRVNEYNVQGKGYLSWGSQGDGMEWEQEDHLRF